MAPVAAARGRDQQQHSQGMASASTHVQPNTYRHYRSILGFYHRLLGLRRQVHLGHDSDLDPTAALGTGGQILES